MAPPRIVKLASLSVAFLVITLFLGCERRGQTADARSESPETPSVPQSMAALAPTASVTDAQSSIQALRRRLKEQFEARSPELKDVAKLHAAWNQAWQSSFDSPLESATKSDVASGQVLPPEIITHQNDNTPAAELFANDQASFVKDRKEFEAAYALTLIASALGMGGGAELPAFSNRAGSLPPTTGDVVVFRAFSDGLLFMNRPAVLNDAQVGGWQLLASARNPIYRLIAARTFHLVSSDLTQRSRMYRGLLADSDPTIARIAVTAASRYSTAETPSALAEFINRQKSLGNRELVDVAARALVRLEKRP